MFLDRTNIQNITGLNNNGNYIVPISQSQAPSGLLQSTDRLRNNAETFAEQARQLSARFAASAPNSERRASIVDNKSVLKIPEFFEGIAGRFKDWKESRNEAALKKKEAALEKSRHRANDDILNGLRDNNFKKVYQGLKRLHNAEQKLSQMGGKVGELDKDAYISEKRLESAVSGFFPYEKNPDGAKIGENLGAFAKNHNDLVDRHSDSKTLFHRMLTGLKGARLISHSDFDLKTQRIKAQDNGIKETLESMNACLLKQKVEHDNDINARFELGNYYHKKGNEGEAMKLWREAGLAGHKPSQEAVSNHYHEGSGVRNQIQHMAWEAEKKIYRV